MYILHPFSQSKTTFFSVVFLNISISLKLKKGNFKKKKKKTQSYSIGNTCSTYCITICLRYFYDTYNELLKER